MMGVLKLHLLNHLSGNIEWHGVATTTKSLEHFHLKIKDAYEASNKQDRQDSSIKQVMSQVMIFSVVYLGFHNFTDVL